MKFNKFISHFHIARSSLDILDHLKVFIIIIPSFPEEPIPTNITPFLVEVQFAGIYLGIVIEIEGESQHFPSEDEMNPCQGQRFHLWLDERTFHE